ncbi:D-inositol-3-phosphate glycosyltransferase [Kocuria dechangensis]|uniref:D-inositol 3-phosphate glycosyltransferase n=1 Tax=Kocuria dechangensis TaxID=1176249 RepID=A0A917GMJ0_9MICC|nr:glycosyltransferase [Kocuria dechangensis]GGG51217.1 D-inositol-3-phosphate glycosyltransferase [Kocuria dechangensis]
MPDAALHVLLVSLHTSPLEQPGSGDAGGMNVYVRHLAAGLADAGHTVDMAVLDRSPDAPGAEGLRAESVGPGMRLLTVTLPGAAGAAKEDLPRFVDPFAAVLGAALDAEDRRPDAVHAHYWLSGAAGRVLADEWGVPLVLSLHTTARAKNLRAALGEGLEPEERAAAEEALVARAEATVVNTGAEAHQMLELYDADPARLAVIAPGVDLGVFHPAGPANSPAASPGVSPGAGDGPGTAARPLRLLFAGRLQALKGPQVLVEALARIRELAPDLVVELEITGVGAPSFIGALRARVRELGLGDSVVFSPALPAQELAARMRRADAVVVPSSSETFGLVALEAQACGTPVLATDVDGLRTAVLHGATGRLVRDRAPGTWARAVVDLARDPEALRRLGAAAARRAREYSWERTARATVDAYGRAGVRDGSRRQLNTLER